MMFEGVIGHGAVCEQLEKEAQSPGHSYLFAGPPNLGKAAIALEFAARLVGARGPDRERVRRRSHPDVAVLGPEGKTGLGVEQARAAIAAAGLQPVESDRKVFIFDDGSMMTEAAANALLKTLEEPSASTVLIIVADAEEDLPVTVASRCRTVRFGRVTDRELARALTERGLSEERAGEAARIAMGRPGLALTFVNRPEVGEFRRRWLSVPGRVTARPGDAFRLADEMLDASAPLLAALEESHSREAEEIRARGAEVPRALLDSRERARQRAASSLTAAGLEMLASWYVDAVAAQHGAQMRNPDLPTAELAKISPLRAVRAAEMALQAVARLRKNQRPRLVLAWLFAGLGDDT